MDKLKDYFIEYSIPTTITAVIFGIIIYFFTINVSPKTKIKPPPLPPSPPQYENKILIPAQPQPPKENIIIENLKIKIKVRITGKYITDDKSYVIYERIDTRKQKNTTVENFLKMCECSATKLYTDRLMEIVEYP